MSDIVPGRGLEPLRISPPDPKSGASANFATLARQKAAQQNQAQDGPTKKEDYQTLTVNASETMAARI